MLEGWTIESLSVLRSTERSGTPVLLVNGQLMTLHVGEGEVSINGKSHRIEQLRRLEYAEKTSIGDHLHEAAKVVKAAYSPLQPRQILGARPRDRYDAKSLAIDTPQKVMKELYSEECSVEHERSRFLRECKSTGAIHTGGSIDELLETIMPGSMGLAMIDGKAFCLTSGSGMTINSASYCPNEVGSEESVVSLHDDILYEHIERCQGLKRMIELDARSHNELVRTLVKKKATFRIEGHANNNRLTVVVHGDQFMMRRRNELYLMQPFQAAYTMRVNGSQLQLEATPVIVYPDDYQHPLVFSDGRICFNGPSRFVKAGITPGEWSKPLDAGAMMELAAYPAIETVKTVHCGYFGNLSPVKRLENLEGNKEPGMIQGVRIYAANDNRGN